MSKRISFIIMMIFILACFSGIVISSFPAIDNEKEITSALCETEAEPEPVTEQFHFIEYTEPKMTLSVEEIELIALVTMAEAEGECEFGKRLVIDTILNRMKSDKWPDTVNEVVYQPNQFTSMWNGRSNRCDVSDYICDLVREELESQVSYAVVYFTAGAFGKYGTPLFQVGNHYFASV
ncbi:MAG: cell wall hydrolase [Ruminococcus sp.]|nr:cell wall hydrolase [Ruminococcus sp.]